MVEVIGIIASMLVTVSFFMNGEKRIRLANLIGSVVFLAYGLMLGSISVIFINLVSIVVNAIKIYKINKENNSNEKNDNSDK